MNITTTRQPTTPARSTWRLVAAGLAATALLAACGDDDTDTDATAAPAEAAPAGTDAPEAAPTGAASVATAETDLGTVLVDTNGMTLYGFTNDADGAPTCIDDCAGAWPPALVAGEPNVGDLDAAVFSVVEHPDGSQLKAGDWPLYTFAGDQAPGDVNGQGSGDIWFVVASDGNLIK